MAVVDNIGKDFPKTEKRQRGRPRLYSVENETRFRNEGMDGRPATSRTVQNVSYAASAMNVLCDGVGVGIVSPTNTLGWLLRPKSNGVACIRWSIMHQLGRTRCPIALKVFAEELCRLKPTATAAVRMIREWQARLDGIAAVRAFQMEDRDVDAIDHDELREQIARQAVKGPVLP